jgi:hypothetical protein
MWIIYLQLRRKSANKKGENERVVWKWRTMKQFEVGFKSFLKCVCVCAQLVLEAKQNGHSDIEFGDTFFIKRIMKPSKLILILFLDITLRSSSDRCCPIKVSCCIVEWWSGGWFCSSRIYLLFQVYLFSTDIT